MAWFKQFIEWREQRWFARELNRRVLPFAWGLEHIGGSAAEPDPRGFLARYVAEALQNSERFFAVGPAERYELRDGILTFPSAIESAYPVNNTVYGRYFPAASAGRAVIVLPQWNAEWDAHVNICQWLNRFGFSALRLSLPYHDRRKPEGLERADYMVAPNIGLTMQASRQAVLDARRAARWLERQGHRQLAILGTSIGSSVAYITMAHEPALRAGVFLHVSRYFGDVVAMGMTTSYVWQGLKDHLTDEEVREFWAPISPYPYVPRLKGTSQKSLLVIAKYDLSFPLEFSEKFVAAIREAGLPHEVLRLPCGHYTLGTFPFSYITGLHFARFLRKSLA